MKRILIFLFLIVSIHIFSQKEANFWYFGENAGLDFNSGNPVPVNGSQLNTTEGCSSFSDTDGNLLFYVGAPNSDARDLTIWDKNNNPMPNGTGLQGDSSSSQSALTVPAPGQPNIYYLFTVGTRATGGNGGIPGFFYYEIDMTLNGGLGDITLGPINLSDGRDNDWTEKVTAVRAEECNVFWVISLVNKSFYAYKVSDAGVDVNNPIISTISDPNNDFNINRNNRSDVRGYLKVSPDGTKLVAANMAGGTFLLNFDPETGIVENFNNNTLPSKLNLNGDGYGVEFSSSSKILYISTGGSDNGTTENLYQFDLTKSTLADINNTNNGQPIFSYSNSRGALQLGPDNKIYWASNNSTNISVINNPEGLGNAANYSHQSINVGAGVKSRQGLPPFLSSLLLPIEIRDTETNQIINNQDLQYCVGDNKTITPEAIMGTNISYEWFFNNGITPIAITSTLPLNNLTTADNGDYSLVVKLINDCNIVTELNATFNLFVNPKPIVNTVDDYIECDFDENTFDGITSFNLKSKEASLIETGADVTVAFFEPYDTSFSDPITNTESYRNKNLNNNGKDKLVVRVTNNQFGCEQFGEINLQATPTTIENYEDIYISEIDLNANDTNASFSDGSGNAIFDFEAKIDNIIANSGGAFNKVDYQFSFYESQNDADNEVNKLESPYLFGNDTAIFIRVSRGNTCAGVGKFKLIINKRPEPKGDLSTKILCITNPITSSQLNTIALDAGTSISSDTYKWYLNNQIINGETNAILEANKEGEYKVEAFRFFENNFSTTEDDITTVGFNTFTVQESNVALLESIDFVDDQDNLSENVITVTVKGKGNYEYALNSTNNSDFKKGEENLSYSFTNVQPGLNKVFIKDINECGIIETQEVSFVYFQRHFSPNNDGKFDTWKIQGVDNNFYSTIDVQIFNRFGKLLKVIDQKTEDGWDGKMNGNLLPSSDYWYNAVLIDINGNMREKTGHFSLISD